MDRKEYFGESKNIEYKREIPSNHERFLKDIIAFSNCSGGKVIVGIEDETNEVCGIGDMSPHKLSDSISTMISDACTPQIDPDISVGTIDDKTILIIDVSPGKFRPYYLVSKGMETSTYIRINGTSRPADYNKIKELEMEGRNISYDSMQDIGNKYDPEKAKKLCAKMKQVAMDSCFDEVQRENIKSLTEEKLLDFGILCKVGKDLCPTHAFNLLTDNTERNARIKCAVFKGTTRDIFIDKKQFSGPIYEQVEEAYQFVLRHINLGARIEGIYRQDIYELPSGAIREMIANAVVHRSYLDEGEIQVSIYDDRLEVTSPGMLYGGLDFETAKRGTSKCRNAAIAEAFQYMHIVESWGTGIPRIISKCKEYGLEEPKFEELGNGIMVTLFRKMVNADEKVGNANEKVGNANEKVGNANEKVGNANEKVGNAIDGSEDVFERYKVILKGQNVSPIFIENIRKVYLDLGSITVFSQKDIMNYLGCSKGKATNIMNTLRETNMVEEVKGFGRGKYKFIEL